MRKSVHPGVAALIIVVALCLIGIMFWREGVDRPISDGPGNGRIGQTFVLGKRPVPEKSSGPAMRTPPKAKGPANGKAKAGAQPR